MECCRFFSAMDIRQLAADKNQSIPLPFGFDHRCEMLRGVSRLHYPASDVTGASLCTRIYRTAFHLLVAVHPLYLCSPDNDKMAFPLCHVHRTCSWMPITHLRMYNFTCVHRHWWLEIGGTDPDLAASVLRYCLGCILLLVVILMCRHPAGAEEQAGGEHGEPGTQGWHVLEVVF